MQAFTKLNMVVTKFVGVEKDTYSSFQYPLTLCFFLMGKSKTFVAGLLTLYSSVFCSLVKVPMIS